MFHMLIGLGEVKNPIDFGFTRSKSQGHFCKKIMFSDQYHDNYLLHSFYISHADWSWRECDLTWFWVHKVKGRGHMYSFCKIWIPIIFMRTICHSAIIFNILIGLGEDMAPFDFGFTRLKVKVTRVTCKKCKHGFCSLSWELFITKITELLYFACWLVFVRIQSLMFWSSLGQRSGLHWSLLWSTMFIVSTEYLQFNVAPAGSWFVKLVRIFCWHVSLHTEYLGGP